MRLSSTYIRSSKNTRVLDMDLACCFGVVEALLISQVQYWIDIKVSDSDHYKESFCDDHCWVYNPYNKWQEQLPCYSEMTIRRAFKHLESLGVILVGKYNKIAYDKTKWYSINYDKLESLVDEYRASVQIEQTICSDRSLRCDQEEQTYTKDFQSTSSHNYVESIRVQQKRCTRPKFTIEVLRNQVKKLCLVEFPEFDVEDAQYIIHYYCYKYYETFGRNHPRVKTEQLRRMFYVLSDSRIGCDRDGLTLMIDKHFSTDYGDSVDYNMNHFFTEGILDNRMYETCY